MQMSSKKGFGSFALDSGEEKFDVLGVVCM